MMQFSYTKPIDSEIDARGGERTRSEKYKNPDATINDVMEALNELEQEGFDISISITLKTPKE